MTTQFLAFNLVLLVAIATPGPALLYALRTTLTGGRRAGMLTGLGLGVMASTWTLLAVLGLNSVFELFPSVYLALRLVGAAYLIHVAIATWRTARDPVEAARSPTSRAFVGGLLLNAANPKSVLFAAAVIVSLFPGQLDAVDKVLIVGNHLVIEVLFYSLLAAVAGSDGFRRGYLRVKTVFDRVAAVVLGVLGLRLLVRSAEGA